MELVNIKGAAALLHISHVMAWKLVQQEKLNSIRVSKQCVLVPLDDKFEKMKQYYDHKR